MKWDDGSVTIREDGEQITVVFHDPDVADAVAGEVSANAGDDHGLQWFGRHLALAAYYVAWDEADR